MSMNPYMVERAIIDRLEHYSDPRVCQMIDVLRTAMDKYRYDGDAFERESVMQALKVASGFLLYPRLLQARDLAYIVKSFLNMTNGDLIVMHAIYRNIAGGYYFWEPKGERKLLEDKFQYRLDNWDAIVSAYRVKIHVETIFDINKVIVESESLGGDVEISTRGHNVRLFFPSQHDSILGLLRINTAWKSCE